MAAVVQISAVGMKTTFDNADWITLSQQLCDG